MGKKSVLELNANFCELSGNGLSGNGMSGNGLSGNGLSGNGMSGNGIVQEDFNSFLDNFLN